MRVPRLHAALQHTSGVSLPAVAGTVLELISSGELPEARRLVAAAQESLERTGSGMATSGVRGVRQWEHARGLCALPDDYPTPLRKTLADAVLRSDFREAVLAFRRHAWLHPVVTPVYQALLRKHAPATAADLSAATPASIGWIKYVAALAVVGFVVFRMGVRVNQVRDGVGPQWAEPETGGPTDGALRAAAFLRARSEWMREEAAVSAARELEDQLQVHPSDCAAISDRIVRIRDAVYRIPTKDSMSMMGAVLHLERRYPELCPGFSLPPARAR